MTKDLVAAAFEERPLEFQKAFGDAVNARISELVDARKVELAKSYMVPPVVTAPSETAPEEAEEPKE